MKIKDLMEAESKADIARRVITQVTSRAEFIRQAREAGIDSNLTLQTYYAKFRHMLGSAVQGHAPVSPSAPPVVKQRATRAKKQPTITDEDLLSAVKDLLRNMKRSQQYNAGFDDPEMQGRGAYAAIRDWGHWINPPDAYDEEDYDWQELSPQSKVELGKLIDRFELRYPGIKFEVSQEEKNWLSIYALRK